MARTRPSGVGSISPLSARAMLRQAELDLLLGERQQDRVLVGEVLIERADADAGALGHGVGREAGQSTGLQNLSSALQDRRRGLGRARLARNSSFYFSGLAACGHGGSGSAKASTGT